MIGNTTKKYIANMLNHTKPMTKGVYPWREWWNYNENGLRCILCNEPVEEEHKTPDGGWPTFFIYIDGVRKIGPVHPICYAAHHHEMGLNIKEQNGFYEGVKSQWKK